MSGPSSLRGDVSASPPELGGWASNRVKLSCPSSQWLSVRLEAGGCHLSPQKEADASLQQPTTPAARERVSHAVGRRICKVGAPSASAPGRAPSAASHCPQNWEEAPSPRSPPFQCWRHRHTEKAEVQRGRATSAEQRTLCSPDPEAPCR